MAKWRRSASAWMIVGLLHPHCVMAQMVDAPQTLQYSTALLQGIDPGTLPSAGALPAGSSVLIMAFAQLLGVVAVARSMIILYQMGGARHQGPGLGSVLIFFFFGIMVFHLDETLAMLAATLPGFPDLSSILQPSS
jgi:hypothetical protein